MSELTDTNEKAIELCQRFLSRGEEHVVARELVERPDAVSLALCMAQRFNALGHAREIGALRVTLDLLALKAGAA